MKIFDHGRVCNGSKCKIKGVQLWEMFHKHKTSVNGHNTHCKACRRKSAIKNKTGAKPKPKSLQSQCDLTWDANGAAAFLRAK